jgi:hypothetical protein
MSKHPRKSGKAHREPEPMPNLDLVAGKSRLRAAAQGARAQGRHDYAALLLAEHGVQPSQPPTISIRLLDDSDARVYGVQAELRTNQLGQLMVQKDEDLSSYDLTDIGREIVGKIANIFGVNFAVVHRHEIHVDIASSFDWDNDAIHGQIMAAILAAMPALVVSDYAIRWVNAEIDDPDEDEEMDPAVDDRDPDDRADPEVPPAAA